MQRRSARITRQSGTPAAGNDAAPAPAPAAEGESTAVSSKSRGQKTAATSKKKGSVMASAVETTATRVVVEARPAAADAVPAKAVKVGPGPQKRKAPATRAGATGAPGAKVAKATKKKKKKGAAASANNAANTTVTAAVSTGSSGGLQATVTAVTSPRSTAKQARAQAASVRFDRHVQLLKEYKEKHGGQEPGREVTVDDNGTLVNLGKWCHNQRQNKKNLPGDKIAKLDELDFSWGRSADAVWNEFFTLLKEYKATHDNEDPSPNVVVEHDGRKVNLGTWCRTQRYRNNSQKLNHERQSLLKSIQFAWGRSPESSFDEYFDALKAYRAEHGVDAPRAYEVKTDEGRTLKLGTWCDRQRRRFAEDRLAKGRVDRLNEIGFSWVVKKRTGAAATWDEMYAALKDFFDQNKELPPRQHVAQLPDGRKVNLGKWCDTQRWYKKQGRLLPEHEELLKALDFQFATNVSAKWEEYYDALVDYKNKNLGRDPLSKYTHRTEDGKQLNLGAWCKTQRKGKKTGSLSKKREELLTKINFKWAVSKAIPFADYYAILTEYKEKHNHTPPSNMAPVVKFGRRLNIAAWCDKMRRLHKKGKLPQDEIEKLNAVNFQWKPAKGPSPAWEDNLAALKQFKEESGQDADPPRKLTVVRPDGRKLNLGKWCDSQRQARKRKVLSDDQIRRLDELGFAWSFNLVVGWQVYFDALKEYKENHANQDPPPHYRHELLEGRTLNLGAWCVNQRKGNKKGTLEPDQVAALNSVGFAWTRTKGPSWEDMWNALKRFKATNDNQDPSYDETVDVGGGAVSKIGKWCDVQRRLKRANKLGSDREVKLNSIGFKWDLPVHAKRKASQGDTDNDDDDGDDDLVSVPAQVSLPGDATMVDAIAANAEPVAASAVPKGASSGGAAKRVRATKAGKTANLAVV